MSKSHENPSITARHSMPTSDAELPALTVSAAPASIKRGRRIALGVLVAIAFLIVAWTASSLGVGLLLGTVLAFTLQGPYRRLARKLGDRPHIAAAIVTVIAALLTLIVGGVTLTIFARELIATARTVQQQIADGSLLDKLGNLSAPVLERFHINRDEAVQHVKDHVENATNFIASGVPMVLQRATGAALQLFVALMTTYYVLIEWPRIAVRLENVLPLDPRHTRALILEFRDVGRSTLRGTVLTALIQGGLSFTGYMIARVPHPLTWALVTAVGSFIPVFGTVLVWLPIGISLIATDHPASGILILIWGFFVVVGLSDYWIRPRIVGAGGHTHPFLMLVSLLGGIEVFGIAGLLVGPILMSLFLAVLRLYERESKRAREELSLST